MKMIISAGGTGGHIYPALAIVKKFQKEDKNFEVLYIGTHNRMENKIVPEHNIPFQSLKIHMGTVAIHISAFIRDNKSTKAMWLEEKKWIRKKW